MADDNDDDSGETVRSLRAKLNAANVRISELNDESKGHRLNAADARKALEAAQAEAKAKIEAADAKFAEAEKVTKDAGERVTSVLRDAALKVAAKDAGILDLDGLKLLDTAGVKVAEDGSVTIPEKFFDEAKASKPYLFKTTAADTGNTSSAAAAPGKTTPAVTDARTLDAAGYAAARAAMIAGR